MNIYTNRISKLLAVCLFVIMSCSCLANDIAKDWIDRIEYVGVAVASTEHQIWGSSPIVDPEGKTHLFVARWPFKTGHPGWKYNSEIAHYVADKPEGPFVFKEVTLKGTGQDTWDKLSPHNPTVHKVGDKYVLLYIANTGKAGGFPANQCIGMAIATNLNGPWRKAGKDGKILAPPTDPSIWSYQSTKGVNNPAFLQHPDGRFFLYYKAMRKGGHRKMGLAISENLEGPYIHESNPISDNEKGIEDGYVFMLDDKVCFITTGSATGHFFISDDGLNFGAAVGGGYPSMPAAIPSNLLMSAHRVKGGDKFERPQLLIQDGKPTYLYLASGTCVVGEGTCSYVFKIRDHNE